MTEPASASSTAAPETSRHETAARPDLTRSFALSRLLFVRLLGLVYLCAFASMWTQVRGLYGARGLLPAAEYLQAVRDLLGDHAYWRVPTLFWFDHSDAALAGVCAAGTVLAGALVIGMAPLPVLTALWTLYLSIVSIGQDFIGFQWDALLLEMGFIALFFAPPRLMLPWRWGAAMQPSAAIRLLLWWLLFRLMFSAGIVKLLSGDPTWRDLSAMRYHYETQPIPAWTSWYLHQLPGAMHTAEVLFTFLIELIVPFLIFGPPALRRTAFVLLTLLQLLIMASGNYGFFNVLTIALAVTLLDDAVFPRRWRRPLEAPAPPAAETTWRARVMIGVALILAIISTIPFASSLGVVRLVPTPLVRLYAVTQPLHLSSRYGLFAVMTTQRPEIVIEGSDDAVTWQPYEFRYKPGDVRRPPPLIVPHMPRLDWQMWFAALGDYGQNPWLASLLDRLLEGSPDVLVLLARNPFPDVPPKFVRARLYDYQFTNMATRRSTGAWWRREEIGLYAPTRQKEPARLEQPAKL